MTDILTRLAALTENAPEGTTPRPWKVGAQNPITGQVDVYREYRDPSFTTTGGRGVRVVATLSIARLVHRQGKHERASCWTCSSNAVTIGVH